VISLTPFLVLTSGGKVLLQQIGRHWQIVVRVGGGLEFFGSLGSQPLPFHAGRHSFWVVVVPLVRKVERQAR